MVDYRHIIINSSFDGGNTWEGQKDLITDMVFLFSECVFPEMAPSIEDNIELVFQEDYEPGINQWLNNHEPDENRMTHMEISKWMLVDVPQSQSQGGFELLAFYPNPVTDVLSLHVNVDGQSSLSFQILNEMGQLVKTLPTEEMISGTNTVNIDLSSLRAGIYFCSLNNGISQLTRKFIVH